VNKLPLDGAICAGHSLDTRQVAGLATYDCIEGEGEPLHFLHGNGFCGLTLAPLAEEITDGSHPLLFTDLPGHGASGGPDVNAQPDWNDMADRVANSIAARIDRPVTGIGHSMGGVVTLLAAARYPDLFSRVVLLDPVLFSREVIFYQRLMRKTGLWQRTSLVRSVARRRSDWPSVDALKTDLSTKSLYRNWTPGALDAFAHYGTRTTEAGALTLACDPRWEASIFGSYPRGLWQAVRTVSVPVDIVVATRSYPFIRPAVKRAVGRNKRISQHVFDGGHCFPMEAPEAAAVQINDILVDSGRGL